jgi:hypothetical protein
MMRHFLDNDLDDRIMWPEFLAGYGLVQVGTHRAPSCSLGRA